MPAPVAPDLPQPLELPLTQDQLDQINNYLSPLAPDDILSWARAHLPALFQTTAFGLTGCAITDMLTKLPGGAPDLIFVDTLYHFKETYELVEAMRIKYGVTVHVYKPEECENVEDFEKKYGEKLWERDEVMYDYAVKVEPARRAYEELGVKSVITGRRASQGADRAKLQPLEVDNTGLLKLNPLFSWNFHLVEWHIQENSVPKNALLDQGYRSIGDWHSTAKAGEGDVGERAGRWAGQKEKTECGLHTDYFALKAEVKRKQEEAARIAEHTKKDDSAQSAAPLVASTA